MFEKLHDRLVKFAKKHKYRSLSEFFAAIGQQEINKKKREKGDIDDEG
jgi:hypothetical protein